MEFVDCVQAVLVVQILQYQLAKINGRNDPPRVPASHQTKGQTRTSLQLAVSHL